VRCGIKCRQLRTRCLKWSNVLHIAAPVGESSPPISTGPALHIRGWYSPTPIGSGPPAKVCSYRRVLSVGVRGHNRTGERA
jgi:hypothetical protein